MKKILTYLLMISTLCSSMFLVANAEHTENHNGNRVALTIPIEDFHYVAAEDPLKDYVPTDMDFLVDTMVTRSSMIQIPIVEFGDQYFQQKYPSNWMWQMHRAACDADGILEQFGVQFYSAAQKSWQSNSSDPDALLLEVEALGLPNGARLVMGFTGRNNEIDDETWYGYAFMPGRHSLVWDVNLNINTITLQHEVGHNYNLDHCYNSYCIMYFNPFSDDETNYNEICATHRSEWQQNRNNLN